MSSSPSAAPESWKQVPADDAAVSKGFQFFHSIQSGSALPTEMRSRVLDAVLPAGESVVASLHRSRVYVTDPGPPTRKFGLGTKSWPFLAATGSRVLLFSEFMSGPSQGGVITTSFGVEMVRQYLELPLAGASISPYSRNRFTLSWSGGIQLEVLPGPPAAPFYLRGPLKGFYATVSELLQSRGAQAHGEG
jgi:hypothetical protein